VEKWVIRLSNKNPRRIPVIGQLMEVVKSNCFKLNRRAEGNGGGYVVFNSISESSELLDIIWIRDSGASCHYCNSDKCLFDIKEVSESITVGSGKSMDATKIGDLCCDVEQVNESSCAPRCLKSFWKVRGM
jgi:hypothetical protein